MRRGTGVDFSSYESTGPWVRDGNTSTRCEEGSGGFLGGDWCLGVSRMGECGFLDGK